MNTNALTAAEKQLISTLTWFRSRYALFLGLDPERKADQQAIDSFGESWMGSFLLRPLGRPAI
jgi:hypothetical protein